MKTSINYCIWKPYVLQASHNKLHDTSLCLPFQIQCSISNTKLESFGFGAGFESLALAWSWSEGLITLAIFDTILCHFGLQYYKNDGPTFNFQHYPSLFHGWNQMESVVCLGYDALITPTFCQLPNVKQLGIPPRPNAKLFTPTSRLAQHFCCAVQLLYLHSN